MNVITEYSGFFVFLHNLYPFLPQRTWGHAPKESYLADGDQFAEQPFGIQVKSQPNLLPFPLLQMQIDKMYIHLC